MNIDASYISDSVQITNLCYRSQTVAEVYDLNSVGIVNIDTLFEQKASEYRLHNNAQTNTIPIATPVTVVEMVEKIRAVFGLNAVQVAEIVGVSRASFYNHTSKNESPKDLESYHQLYDVARRIETQVAPDLKRGLKTVLVDGQTLLQHLKQRPMDVDRLAWVAKQVQAKLPTTSRSAAELSLDEQRMVSRSITKTG